MRRGKGEGGVVNGSGIRAILERDGRVKKKQWENPWLIVARVLLHVRSIPGVIVVRFMKI